jgi:hypothetical protein
MKPAIAPRLAMLDQSTTRTGRITTPRTRQVAVTAALFSQTWKAKSAAGLSE